MDVDDLFGRPERERVLTATWTPHHGVLVASSDLPDTWSSALTRVGRDLHVHQYGGSIDQIDWYADYDAETGHVLVLSDVTATGRGPNGAGMSGGTPRVDDDEETVAASIADLVQDQIARTGIAWPRGAAGGFMTARLIDGIASWCDIDEHCVVGTLR